MLLNRLRRWPTITRKLQRQKAVSAYFTSKQILPFAFARKGKRQYLLTLHVSRYCLLPFHGSIVRCDISLVYEHYPGLEILNDVQTTTQLFSRTLQSHQ